MNFGPFKKTSLIGLDIHPDGIRLLHVEKNRKGKVIQHAAIKPLPPHFYQEGRIQQWEVLQQVVSEWVATFHLKNQPTAIDLPAHLVRMQRIKLPIGLTDKEIEEEIHLWIQKELPTEEKFCIDFTLLPNDDSNDNTLFYSMTRQEYLWQFVKKISASGLKVKIVDVDVYAIARSLQFLFYTLEALEPLFALLYVQETLAYFIVCHQDEVIFSEQWSLPVSDWNAQLKQTMRLFQATYPHLYIKRHLLCYPTTYARDFLSVLPLEWREAMPPPSLFASLSFANAMTRNFFMENANLFLTCLGLTLRSVA